MQASRISDDKGFEVKTLDDLGTGLSGIYAARYGGVELTGEALSLGSVLLQPGTTTVNKYTSGPVATFIELIVPVEEG